MSFTVSQILAAARRNPELLTSETAAYMVLSLTEQSLSGPRRVCAEHVLLHPGGAVTIGDVEPCANPENGVRLRALLRDLLDCAAPATASEALEQVAHGRGDGPSALRAELQNALVPLNRGAARRALARLYRRLSNTNVSVSAEDVARHGDEQSGVSRRPKRRQATPVSEDSPVEIPVAVDETAFRVLSTAHRQLTATDSDAAGEPSSSLGAGANWHPAQTTPWQFRASATGEGTPILGSLAVQERVAIRALASDPEQAPPPFNGTRRVHAPDAADEGDSAPAVEAVPFELWADTFVDAEVAAPNEPTVAAPTFNPRRSRVADLVQRIPTQTAGFESARKGLLEMVNASDEPEFNGLGTVTPPPVAREEQVTPSRPTGRGPRRIVLSSLAAALAGGLVWLTMTSGENEPASEAVASPPDCAVRVQVQVPAAAKVFLNDAKERLAQSGPVARFDGVLCAGQAEVTVQVPSPDGSPLPDAWVRMPLPEVELRAAFEGGRPFVVAPLGEHE